MMRKILKLLGAGVLGSALCAGFAACNDPKGSGQPDVPLVVGTVLPAAAPEEIAAFFEKYLLRIPNSVDPQCFFVGDEGNKCLMVSSAKELKAIMSSSVEPPTIDFGKYSLIIGQQSMPTSNWYVADQNLDVKKGQAVLNLTVVRRSGWHTTGFTLLPYWGLYPKLNSGTKVVVNTTYI